MKKEYRDLLKKKCGEENFKKLEAIDNPKMHDFVAKYVELCDPDSVFVRTDSKEDNEYIRRQTIANGEENDRTTTL